MKATLDFTEHTPIFNSKKGSRENVILLNILNSYGELDFMETYDNYSHVIAVFLREEEGEAFFDGYLNVDLEKSENELKIGFWFTILDKKFIVQEITYDFDNFLNGIEDNDSMLKELTEAIKKAIEEFKIEGNNILK